MSTTNQTRVTVTLRAMLHEVGAPRNGKPGYRWATRYIVIRPDGTEEHPPVTRAEGYARAREIGGARCRVVIA